MPLTQTQTMSDAFVVIILHYTFSPIELCALEKHSEHKTPFLLLSNWREKSAEYPSRILGFGESVLLDSVIVWA